MTHERGISPRCPVERATIDTRTSPHAHHRMRRPVEIRVDCQAKAAAVDREAQTDARRNGDERSARSCVVGIRMLNIGTVADRRPAPLRLVRPVPASTTGRRHPFKPGTRGHRGRTRSGKFGDAERPFYSRLAASGEVDSGRDVGPSPAVSSAARDERLRPAQSPQQPSRRNRAFPHLPRSGHARCRRQPWIQHPRPRARWPAPAPSGW